MKIHRLPTLTPRQSEVLALVAQGKRNQQIARALCITEHTVEAHLRAIFQKLAVRTRTAASTYYWRSRQPAQS
ncbi:MAG TPA: LuxR C-terminal-related transcriptional regulator [Herpetosiphonaceae bacterium]